MTAGRDQALRTLAEAWLGLRRVAPGTDFTIERVEVLRPGRPGLLEMVVAVGERRAHLVVGLRAVGEEPHFLRAAEECALGLLDDDHGLAVCTDALRDARIGAAPTRHRARGGAPSGAGRHPA